MKRKPVYLIGMQTTLTLYPRFERPITLVIRYVAELDGAEIEALWDVDRNYVALSWRMYRDFSRIEKQSEKREFFDKLHKVSKKSLPE
jgi:hypothetical protein